MKNIFKKLLGCLLVIALIFGSTTPASLVFAAPAVPAEAPPELPADPPQLTPKGKTQGLEDTKVDLDPSIDNQGFVSYGWRIGLSQCTKEQYPNSNPTDKTALADWVVNYNSKYYTRIASGCEIVLKKEVPASEVVREALGLDITLPMSGDRYVIADEDVDAVMEAIVLKNGANADLYNVWREQSTTTGPYYPVVISVEPIVISTLSPSGWTVYEYAQQVGANMDAFSAEGYTLSSQVQGKSTASGLISGVSATADYIFRSAGWYDSIQTDNNILYRLFKGYFSWTYGYKSKRLDFKTAAAGNGYHQVGYFAIGRNGDVAGNYIISIGGTPSGDDLYGKYTWHINDQHLPAKNGYQEDGSSSTTGGSEDIPAVGFAFKQNNSTDWLWALSGGSGDVTAEITYMYGYDSSADEEAESVAQGGCGYTTDRNVILGSSLSKTQTVSINREALKESVKNGTPISSIDNVLIAQGVPSGGYASFSFCAATKCVLRFDGYDIKDRTNRSTRNYTVSLSNTQVHYAIHGDEDELRTYKFIQQVDTPNAQVRDEAVQNSKVGELTNEADYEITAGIPTTNDVMVTMGGDLWVVNMQYRYCVDNYTRTYHLSAPGCPNYMWYGLTSSSGSNSQSYTATKTASYNTSLSTNGAYNNTLNGGWSGGHTSTTSDELQSKAYDAMIDAAIADLEAKLGGITENNAAGADYVYDCIILPSSPDNVQTAGKDEGLRKSTKTAIENYYKWLKARQKEKGTIRSGKDALSAPGLSYSNFTVTMAKATVNKDLDSDKSTPLTWTLGFHASNPQSAPRSSGTYATGGYHHGSSHDGVCEGASHPNHGGSVTTSECAGTGQKLCSTCGGRGEKSCPTEQDCPGNHSAGVHCTICNDTGKIKCTTCGGSGKQPCPTHVGCDSCSVHTHYGPSGAGGGNSHADRNYTDTWGYSISYSHSVAAGDFLTSPTEHSGISCGQNVSYDATINQVFHNVKYMDILECQVFRLHKGLVKGLGNILTTIQSDSLETNEEVLEMYCNTVGYEIYNVAQPNQKKWMKNYQDIGGASSGVWRAIDANDLEEINRIANSYNPGTSEAASAVQTSSHGFELTNSGDNLEFVYDISTKGGRSHHSIDGFIMQALACTFYTKARLPQYAVRNYITVQGDFLALGDPVGGLLAMCGMSYNLRDFVTNLDTNQPATFSILSCVDNTISDFKTTDSGEGGESQYFTIDKGNSKADANASAQKGNVTSYKDKLKELTEYMDHPEYSDQTSDPGDLGDGNSTDVFLDSSGEGAYSTELGTQYRTWSANKVNLESSNTSWYTNFKVIGADPKSGDVPTGIMPKVGYKGGTPVMKTESFTYSVNALSNASAYNVAETPYLSGTMASLGHTFTGGEDSIFYANNLEPNAENVDTGSQLMVFPSAGTIDPDFLGDVPTEINGSKYVYFPFATGLNIGRYKGNDTYGGYTGCLEYDKCVGFLYPLPKVLSVDILSGYDGSDGMLGKPIGDYSDTNTVIGSVGQGQGLRSPVTSLNSVVIYNPSTSESAQIVPKDNTLSDGRGKGAYGTSDQRVSTQYVTSGNETYMNIGNLGVTDIKLPTSYEFKLKETSDVPTKCYTNADFNIDTTNDVTTSGVGADGVFEATKSDMYNLVLYGNNGNIVNQVTVKLNQGDKLKSTGSVVTLERIRNKAPNVTYDTIKEAYEEYMTAQLKKVWDTQEHTEEEVFEPYVVTGNSIPITANTVLTFGLDNIPLQAGDVVKLELDFSTIVQPSISYSCKDPEAYEIHAIPEGTKWTWYLEAKSSNALGTLTMTFNQDSTLKQFEGSCINFNDVFIMNNDSINAGAAMACGSYEWEYQKSQETSGKYYNEFAALYIDAKIRVNASIKANTLYVINTTSKVNVGYKASALNDPHKVENTNWRYHVLGWTTNTGVQITSPTMEVLNNETTILTMPSGTKISIKDIKDQGCLVQVGGKVYFTTIADGLQHKVSETGRILAGDNPHFDYINVWSKEPSNVLVFNSESYPLQYNMTQHYTNVCEFFIRCTDSDKPVFDVSKATNLEFRYSNGDISKTYDSAENWTHDWERVAKSTEVFNVINGKSTSTSTLQNVALDDMFQIYWDNAVDIPNSGGDALQGSTTVSNTLGDGWNNNFADRNGVQDAESIYNEYLQKITKGNYTDTTKWIAEKYLVFDRPVYAFLCNGVINPTALPFGTGDDGKCPKCGQEVHEVQLIPAGTKIYLGTYNGTIGEVDFKSDTTGDGENGGLFVDFGDPDTTLNEDHPYVYTFWSALGGGETKSAVVECEVININGRGNEANNSNTEYNNHSNPPGTTNRFTNAKKSLQYTISGRIGALTIVESTDPRFSDTFKYAGDSTDYLIFPLIRKIASYSNLEAVHGSQHRYLLDPFDVRGRIASKDMLEVVKENYVDKDGNTGKYDNYNIYGLGIYKSALVNERTKTWLTHVSEYNTYGTQWFKGEHDFDTNYNDYVDAGAHMAAITHNDADDAEGETSTIVERVALPMTGSFNSHPELKLTPLRIGYELYCSLESIGAYYGESHMDLSADDGASETTNAALDYNNRKVQIRPRYFYVPKNASESDEGVSPIPVDVYMNTSSGYQMINTGSDVPENYLRLLTTNRFVSSLPINTGKNETDLDQNMQRRLVTGAEAQITKNVLDYLNSDESRATIAEGLDHTANWISLLTPIKSTNTGVLGSEDLNPTYTYGNAQFLFLREKNRTFVGGSTAGLLSQDSSMTQFGDSSTYYNANNSIAWNMNAQKWYFGLGLPSSSKFVKSGDAFTEKNTLTDGYILVTIDVVINGSYWTLQYQSDVARMKLEVAGKKISWKYFNKPDGSTWNIPVTYYDLSDYTSSADLDTEGSH